MTKELEDLIKATLEDGKLEDYEKEALVKRAQKEGMDLVELEIYINAELQKRQRELREKNEALDVQYEKEKKEAIGPVCPKCGKQVPPLTLVCDCGFEFTNNRGESAVKKLFDQINDIQLTEAEIDSCSEVVKERIDKEYRAVKDSNGNVVKKVNDKALQKLKEKKKLNLIQTFPVPNTKEDIIEFLALAAPNAKHKGGILGSIFGRLKVVIVFLIVLFILEFVFLGAPEYENDPIYFVYFLSVFLGIFAISLVFGADNETLIWNKKANIWRAKFEQVLMKGRSLRGDSDFQQQLDYYENLMNQYKKEREIKLPWIK